MKPASKTTAERRAEAALQRARIVVPRMICGLEWRDGPCRPIAPHEKHREAIALFYGACVLGTVPALINLTLNLIRSIQI